MSGRAELHARKRREREASQLPSYIVGGGGGGGGYRPQRPNHHQRTQYADAPAPRPYGQSLPSAQQQQQQQQRRGPRRPENGPRGYSYRELPSYTPRYEEEEYNPRGDERRRQQRRRGGVFWDTQAKMNERKYGGRQQQQQQSPRRTMGPKRRRSPKGKEEDDGDYAGDNDHHYSKKRNTFRHSPTRARGSVARPRGMGGLPSLGRLGDNGDGDDDNDYGNDALSGGGLNPSDLLSESTYTHVPARSSPSSSSSLPPLPPPPARGALPQPPRDGPPPLPLEETNVHYSDVPGLGIQMDEILALDRKVCGGRFRVAANTETLVRNMIARYRKQHGHSTRQMARDLHEAGAKGIWVHRGTDPGGDPNEHCVVFIGPESAYAANMEAQDAQSAIESLPDNDWYGGSRRQKVGEGRRAWRAAAPGDVQDDRSEWKPINSRAKSDLAQQQQHQQQQQQPRQWRGGGGEGRN